MQIYVDGKKRDAKGVFDDYLDPKSTAVISIDMHRGHLEDSPECPCPGPRARTIIEPINAFHRQVRSLGVQLIHVRTVLRPNSIDDANGLGAAWRRTMPLYIGEIPNAPAHAIQGSKWTDFMTETLPSDHFVETKKRLSAFYPTDLDFLLRNLRVNTVILNGGFTDCCVLNAAFDASNRDYKVIVCRDLVAGSSEDMENYALKIMSLYLGAVMDSNDLIAEWSRLAKAA